MQERTMVKRTLMISFLGLLLGAGLVVGARAGEKKIGSFNGWFSTPTVCGEAITFHDEANGLDYFVTPQNAAEGFEDREIVIQGTLEDYNLTVESIKTADTHAGN
jgi:hypothetical protein